MTPAAILDALITVAPPAIALHATKPNRCIFATRIGCEVLRYFGIAHAPLAVNVTIVNAAYHDWVQAGQPGSADEIRARGVHLLRVDESVEGPGWAGHCVIEIPGGFLDLDLQQFQRPQKDINLPAAASFETSTAAPWIYAANGAWLRYEPRRGDMSFTKAPDWTAHASGRHPVAGLLIRAIKRAGPVEGVPC